VRKMEEKKLLERNFPKHLEKFLGRIDYDYS
jgi:hypothetical protein